MNDERTEHEDVDRMDEAPQYKTPTWPWPMKAFKDEILVYELRDSQPDPVPCQ